MTTTYSLFLSSQPNSNSYVPHHGLLLPVCLTVENRESPQAFPNRLEAPRSRSMRQKAQTQKGDPFDIELTGTQDTNSKAKKHYRQITLSFIDSQTKTPVDITQLELHLIPLNAKSYTPSPTPLHQLNSLNIQASSNGILVRELTKKKAASNRSFHTLSTTG